MSYDIHITIEGSLARDPEVKYTSGGRAVASFSVGVGERRKNSDGQWEDDVTSWFDCTAWGDLGENVCESLRKGDRVIVIGSISTDQWADKQTGEKRSKQKLTANAVGPSLKWATATVVRNERRSGAPNRPADNAPAFQDESPY